MAETNLPPSSLGNSTALMNPQDIFLAFPRLLARAGSFAFVTVPEKLDSVLGFGFGTVAGGGSVIAEATTGNNGSRGIWSAALSGIGAGGGGGGVGVAKATAAGAAAVGQSGAAEGLSTGAGGFMVSFFQQVRSFGGVFAYVTSKWALACCALAIILNRTQIYASARRRITLTWPIRLLIRLMPMLLFLVHTLSLLQAMRCQTSSQYSFLKYGKVDKQVDLDFSGDGGFLYYLSSTLLFWEGDADSCLAVDMIPSTEEAWDRRGSLSLLWPFFQALCFGQFVETLSCALQGRPLMTETGMSIFEHSLAFAEAEGMLSNTLGLSPFGLPKTGMGGAKFSAEDTGILTRNALFYKLNTPPEVLLLALISALNNLSSQFLGVINMQNRFRLLNTGIWGMCFLSAFIWGFFSIRPESGPENIMLRIPTVCIVGFIPHLLIIVGMLLCATIYSLALFLCFLSPPADSVQPRNLWERFIMAKENMQANAQISNIRLDMQEDFYTALLKIGFSALTVASEAVYLNEGQRISVSSLTWLEEERMKEVEAFDHSNDPAHCLSVQVEGLTDQEKARGVSQTQWRSGYARSTSVKAVKSGPRGHSRRTDGIGHLQRGGRYFMAYEYFEGIFWLFVSWLRLVASKVLDNVGISRRPQWLRQPRVKAGVEEGRLSDMMAPESQSQNLDFWMLSDEGILSLPEDDNVDVEQETRRRLAQAHDDWEDTPIDEKLDKALYDWWKHNGWWGEKDESGSYTPSQAGNDPDEDLTSIVSNSTAASEADSDDDDDVYGHDTHNSANSGRSTPTQEHPYRRPHSHHSPSPSPHPFTDHALTPSHLASLLNPTTPSARTEAQMLAHHLSSPTITTRSAYTSAVSSRAAKLLTSTRYRPPGSALSSTSAAGVPRPLTRAEESLLLEEMILARRNRHLHPFKSNNQDPSSMSPNAAQADPTQKSWHQGGDGAGSAGPQCVVCQSAPRTVLAWPCRCLSLCEECRVSLAMNNFGTCVCCRREVVGFSRLFVP